MTEEQKKKFEKIFQFPPVQSISMPATVSYDPPPQISAGSLQLWAFSTDQLQEMMKAAYNLALEDAASMVHVRKQESHNDARVDEFISGKFWEAHDIWERIIKLKIQ